MAAICIGCRPVENRSRRRTVGCSCSKDFWHQPYAYHYPSQMKQLPGCQVPLLPGHGRSPNRHHSVSNTDRRYFA